ncbi:ABC transporter transmembrane domain-containing protein, partial [Lactobacillus delbrueckii subsp. bulgaricus]|nr:ABC transporter ATP-binding protein [Lactobacillus delbrueckii subsp. bulgaricus]
SFISYILSSLATYLFSKQTQKYIHSIRHKLISEYYHDKAPKVAEMENELNSNLQVLTKNYADQSLSIIQSSFLLVTSISSLLL